MAYGIAADVVLVVHALFVAFVIAGGLLAMRWRWWAWLHLPAAAWGAFVEVTGGLCPLTTLEHNLRVAAGEPAFGGSFLGHYLEPLIYPPGLTVTTRFALAAAVIAVNLAVYAAVYRRRRRRSRRRRR